jgi:hypothetical protein
MDRHFDAAVGRMSARKANKKKSGGVVAPPQG